MIKILTKRERIILFITVSVIIFAISFNFVITPVLTKNNNLNKEINLTWAKLKKYLWLLSQKDYIQAKFSKFSSLPEVSGEQEDVLVGILSGLENLAKNASIKIIDVRPQISRDLELHREIIVDLRTEGTIEGYLKFLYNIENYPSLFKIKRFQLNAKHNNLVLEGSFSISQTSLSE